MHAYDGQGESPIAGGLKSNIHFRNRVGKVLYGILLPKESCVGGKVWKPSSKRAHKVAVARMSNVKCLQECALPVHISGGYEASLRERDGGRGNKGREGLVPPSPLSNLCK